MKTYEEKEHWTPDVPELSLKKEALLWLIIAIAAIALILTIIYNH